MAGSSQKRRRLPAGLYRKPSGIVGVHFWDKYGREWNLSTGTRDRDHAIEESRRIRDAKDREPPDAVARQSAGGRLTVLAQADIREAAARGCSPEHVDTLRLKWGVILGVLPQGAHVRDLVEQTPAGPSVRAFAIWYEGERRGAGIRGQTIVRETAAIRRAITEAHRRGEIPIVPTDWPRVKRDPKNERRRGKYRSPELVRRYLELLHTDARDEVEFAVYTGVRFAELKRIRPEYFEPLAGGDVPAILRLPAAATKTKREDRIIPVSRPAFVVVQRRMAADPGAVFVFSRSDFKHHRAEASQRAQGKAKPPRQARGAGRSGDYGKGEHANITLRDMRHTFATEMMRAGVDHKTILAIMGHTTLDTTVQYWSTDQTRIAAAGAAVEQRRAVISAGLSERFIGAVDNDEQKKDGIE